LGLSRPWLEHDFVHAIGALNRSRTETEACALIAAETGRQTSPRSLREMFVIGKSRFPHLVTRGAGEYLNQTGQVPVTKAEPYAAPAVNPARVSSASSDVPATPGRFASVDTTADRAFIMRDDRSIPTGLPLSQYGRTTFVISDVHAPFHDPEVWATKMSIVRFTRPDTVVIVGDFLDAYSISFFPKSPTRKARLIDEIEEAIPLLDELEALRVPNVFYLQGNHEERQERLILTAAPALDGMVRTIPEVLRIRERGWHWVPYKHSISIGKMRYSHDFSRFGINATRQALLDVGRSCTFGHSHRLGVAYQGQIEDSGHVAMNVGWAGDFEKVDYAHRDRARRDWMHGCGIVDEDEHGNVWPQAVAILNGAAKVRGQKVAA
jgi:predicted phosphodiesterase